LDSRFDQFRPLGSKATKGMSSDAIFRTFSNGVKSNCDAYVLNFNREALIKQARAMVVDYNSQRDRWMRAGCPKALDNVLQVDESVHKWIYDTKESLLKGREAEYDERHIRQSLFRPFTPQYYFFDPLFNNRLYLFRDFLPTVDTEAANRVICVSQTNEKPFTVLATNRIANLVVTGGFGSVTQCFPFYTYNEDGTEKRENIPLGTLVSFQNHYENSKITKWDIFHYIYALLHHPEYREAFAGNLKRELPRIPLIGGVTAFHDLAATGKALTKLHVKYESVKEFPLKHIEDKEVPLNWRVEKMKLTPDKGRIIYNEFLTLDGIPAKAFEYRLGNRSALEWVIDQYQVSVDPRSGIESDPNRLDDEQYIVRLIGQVITVSLETQKLIESLPEIDLATAS
jgi:predicted helicase